MMQRGVSLIELMIALVISSLLALMLFGILNQAGNSLKSVESIAATDLAIVSFYDRFERDITGAFIPAIGDPDLADKAFAQQLKQAQEKEEKSQAQQQQQQPQNTSAIVPQKKPEKSVSLQDIQVKKVFVYEEKDNNLAQFSFVTCNPVSSYREEKPRIVRVVYTLKPEAGTKNYILWRQESIKLGTKFALQARAYALLRHVVSLRLELLAPKPLEDKDKKAVQDGKQEKKSTTPLITFNQWPTKGTESEKEPTKDLPQFVKVYVRYADSIDNRIKSYEFLFPIGCFRAPSQSILNVQLIHQQRENQKKEQAQQQTQQAQQAQQAQPPVQKP